MTWMRQRRRFGSGMDSGCASPQSTTGLSGSFCATTGSRIMQLVDSQGATEGTVVNETAEAIADITSSGETLRANQLKVLSDGLILASQATLWRSRAAQLDEADRRALKALLLAIGKSA